MKAKARMRNPSSLSSRSPGAPLASEPVWRAWSAARATLHNNLRSLRGFRPGNRCRRSKAVAHPFQVKQSDPHVPRVRPATLRWRFFLLGSATRENRGPAHLASLFGLAGLPYQSQPTKSL